MTYGFPAARDYTVRMDQRKMFWLLASAMSVLAGLALPLIWSLAATIPILVMSWWIVYRSDWL
ncbi:MAG: hypothetical protein KGL59_02115 [Acidobacteriota bacterium]|nr:hypothetical protein [Acidobacteriota bacterium]